MVAVANVRVNTQAPFPTMVTGTGPITLAKSVGGVWQVSLSYMTSQLGEPTTQSLTNQYVLIYDSFIQQFFRAPLSVVSIAGSAKIQRSVTTSPITVGITDIILNVNISSGTPTCTLPQASTREGVPVTFKDVGGNFNAHGLVITSFAGDTIDGASSLVLSTNRQSVTLVPFNDGVNTGWAIE